MINQNIIIRGFLLSGALVFGAPLFAQQQGNKPPLSQKDAESIVQEFEAKYIDAYNRSDSKAVAALFTEDGLEFGGFGDLTQGRKNIEKFLALGLSSPPKMKTVDTPKDVMPIGNDVIVTQGASVRTNIDGSGSAVTIFYTKVLVLQHDQWLVAAVQYAIPPSRYVGEHPRPNTH